VRRPFVARPIQAFGRPYVFGRPRLIEEALDLAGDRTGSDITGGFVRRDQAGSGESVKLKGMFVGAAAAGQRGDEQAAAGRRQSEIASKETVAGDVGLAKVACRTPVFPDRPPSFLLQTL